ncbi:MAG: hypothetical protein Q6363_002185 [Candidatus Njordarchaeota archaeon]
MIVIGAFMAKLRTKNPPPVGCVKPIATKFLKFCSQFIHKCSCTIDDIV